MEEEEDDDEDKLARLHPITHQTDDVSKARPSRRDIDLLVVTNKNMRQMKTYERQNRIH